MGKIYFSTWEHFRLSYQVTATTWGGRNSCPCKTRTRKVKELSLDPPWKVWQINKTHLSLLSALQWGFFCSTLLSWSSVCSGPFWSQSNLHTLTFHFAFQAHTLGSSRMRRPARVSPHPLGHLSLGLSEKQGANVQEICCPPVMKGAICITPWDRASPCLLWKQTLCLRSCFPRAAGNHYPSPLFSSFDTLS